MPVGILVGLFIVALGGGIIIQHLREKSEEKRMRIVLSEGNAQMERYSIPPGTPNPNWPNRYLDMAAMKLIPEEEARYVLRLNNLETQEDSVSQNTTVT